MNFRSIIVTSLLVGLVIFAFFTYSINFASDNNSNVSIMQDSRINNSFSDVNSKLSNVSATADTQRQAFENEGRNPIITQLGFVFSSIVSAGNVFMSMGIGLFTSTFTVINETFFNNAIVFGVIMAILVFTIVFSIWRVIRAGEVFGMIDSNKFLTKKQVLQWGKI